MIGLGNHGSNEMKSTFARGNLRALLLILCTLAVAGLLAAQQTTEKAAPAAAPAPSAGPAASPTTTSAPVTAKTFASPQQAADALVEAAD